MHVGVGEECGGVSYNQLKIEEPVNIKKDMLNA